MTTVADINAKVAKDVVNMDRFDLFVNGLVTDVVTTDNGPVQSLAGIASTLVTTVVEGANETLSTLTGTVNGLSTNYTTLAGRVTTLESATSGASIASILTTQGRPGDAAPRYSGASGYTTIAGHGRVARLIGPGVLSMSERIALDAGKTLKFEWVFARTTNPSDPTGDTVEANLDWYTQDGTFVSTTTVFTRALVVADGWQDITRVVNAAPTNGFYVSASLKTFGSTDSVTACEILAWKDITEIIASGGDVGDQLANETAARQAADATLTTAVNAANAAVAAETARAVTFEGRLAGVPGPITGQLYGVLPDALLIDDASALIGIHDNSGRFVSPGRTSAPLIGRQTAVGLFVGRQPLDGLLVGRQATGTPIPGLLDASAADSVPTLIEYASDGSIQRATAVGSPWRSVVYTGTPGGLVRNETPVVARDISVTGVSVSVPASRRRNGQGWQYLPGYAFVAPTSAPVAVSNETVNVVDGSNSYLGYMNLASGPTVRRSSDNALLTEGTDYRIDYVTGAIIGIAGTYVPSGSYVTCKVSYSGLPQRADILSWNPSTSAWTYTQGLPAPRAPEMLEPLYPGRFMVPDPGLVTLNSVPAGDIRAYRIYVSSNGLQVQALDQWSKHIWTEKRDDEEAHVAEMRRRAATIRRLAAQVTSFRYAADGDSLNAVTSASLTSTTMNSTPNVRRDTIGYFENWPSSVLSLVPTYTNGDGYTHHREGQQWRIAKAIAAVTGRGFTRSGDSDYVASATPLIYDNWAIGGTTIQNSVATNGVWNRGYSSHLGTMLATNPTLVVLGDMQNDLASTTFYADLMAYGQTVLNAGVALMFIMGCKTHISQSSTWDNWLRRCADMQRAADDLDIPYIDTRRLFTTSRMSAAGLTPYEYGTAGMPIHPGIKQAAAVADLGAQILC